MFIRDVIILMVDIILFILIALIKFVLPIIAILAVTVFLVWAVWFLIPYKTKDEEEFTADSLTAERPKEYTKHRTGLYIIGGIIIFIITFIALNVLFGWII